MASVKISSLGSCLPERVVTNFDLEKFLDTSDEWISTRTGIRQRRIAMPDEKASTIACGAARQALDRAGLAAQDVDLIVVATCSGDSPFPPVSCLVQREIGNTKAATYDLNTACCGFVFAITTAKQFLLSGMYRNALVIAAEKFSKILDWADRSTCVLFGDGAGACVLERTEENGQGMISEYLLGLGQYSHLLEVIEEERIAMDLNSTHVKAPYVTMSGQELFKVAVNSMAEGTLNVVGAAGLTTEDVDLIVPHQANDRIIQAVAKKLKVPTEKVFVNIQNYGNMSAASIPVALVEAREQGLIKQGSVVVLTAFGAGLTSASSLIRWC